MKKLKSLFFCLAIVTNAMSQSEKDSIIKHFDWVVYNLDSSINSAFHIKDGAFNGYAIFYDTSTHPQCIGYYTNGKPEGIWLKSGGGFIDFTTRRPMDLFP